MSTSWLCSMFHSSHQLPWLHPGPCHHLEQLKLHDSTFWSHLSHSTISKICVLRLHWDTQSITLSYCSFMQGRVGSKLHHLSLLPESSTSLSFILPFHLPDETQTWKDSINLSALDSWITFGEKYLPHNHVDRCCYNEWSPTSTGLITAQKSVCCSVILHPLFTHWG